MDPERPQAHRPGTADVELHCRGCLQQHEGGYQKHQTRWNGGQKDCGHSCPPPIRVRLRPCLAKAVHCGRPKGKHGDQPEEQQHRHRCPAVLDRRDAPSPSRQAGRRREPGDCASQIHAITAFLTGARAIFRNIPTNASRSPGSRASSMHRSTASISVPAASPITRPSSVSSTITTRRSSPERLRRTTPLCPTWSTRVVTECDARFKCSARSRILAGPPSPRRSTKRSSWQFRSACGPLTAAEFVPLNRVRNAFTRPRSSWVWRSMELNGEGLIRYG